MLEQKERCEEPIAPIQSSSRWLSLALGVLLPMVLALLCFFVLADRVAAPELHTATLAALDEKKDTVMELTAAATATSAAITLIPGDTATPIAEKLADLSFYFLLVLCAIYLEKYLVTLTGLAAFKLILPLACLLWAGHSLFRRPSLAVAAKKLLVFGVAILLIIPASVKVSQLIEDTYATSIQATLQAAQDAGEALESESESQEEQGILSGLISQVESGVSSAADRAQNALSRFMEALAVMLVTSCVIPILVLLFFVWLTKLVLGLEVSAPALPHRPGRRI